MSKRYLPPIVAAALTSVCAAAGVVLPVLPASAGVDCTPVIDQHSMHVTPATSKIAAGGSTTIAVRADFSAPCGASDGADLFVTVNLTPVDFEHGVQRTVSEYVVATGPHQYRISAAVKVSASKVANADAGAWTAAVGVYDIDDPGEYDLTTYSDEVSFSIRRATKVSANASPEPVHKGKKITVRGTLTRANWDTGHGQRFAHQPVRLQFRTPSGGYTTVKTVHSSSKGKIKATTKAGEDGYYRFVFPGSGTSAPVASAGDYVNVK